MKKVWLFFVFLLVLGVNFLNALEVQDFQNICNQVDNNQLKDFEIPSYIPYSDEVFNYYILEENLNGSIVIENSKFTSINCQENENPTYTIYIKNINILKEIQEAEDGFNIYNEKVANKEIEIKGITWNKKIKIAFTKLVLKVVSWFR